MCCGTCTIVRLKSPDVFNTHYDAAGNVLDELALPTAPLAPPTGVGVGHTLIEQYDNGLVFWTYDGTNWVQNFAKVDDPHVVTTFNDEAGNTIDEAVLPTVPLNPPATPVASDTLIENYDNGQVYWTYDGANWNRDFVIFEDTATHVDSTGNLIDFNTLPTVPLTLPTAPTSGDTIIERYDNGTIYWTFDGTNWVQDFIDDDADSSLNTFNDEPGNAIDETALPTAPLNPPANPSSGDTLVENYENGQIFWVYDGTNWNIEFVVPDGTTHTHVDSTGNTLDELVPPTNPTTAPSNPLTGDTISEFYDNGVVYWTYDGTTWVLDNYDVRNEYCCTYIVESDPYDCATPPTVPTNPPATARVGDTLIERYNRVTMYWEYTGSVWNLVTETVHQKVEYATVNATVDLAALPTAPNAITNDTLTYSDNDLLIEFYDNIAILWRFECGTGWVQTGTLDTANPRTQVDVGVNAYDCAALPTVPGTPPAAASTGDIYIELFDQAIIYWEYDGTNWTILHSYELHTTYYDDQTAVNITIPLAAPATFTNDTTSYVTGDLLVEQYADGNAIWRYDCATGWILISQNNQTSGNVTTVDTPAGLYDCATPPTAPETPPAASIAGDIHIEFYDRVTMYWSYDGTTWNLEKEEFHNLHYQVSVTLNTLDALALPTTPVTPGATTDYLDGDTLVEFYSNGLLYWNYIGCTWLLEYSKVESVAGNATNVANPGTYDCATPPTGPSVSPATVANGDVFIDLYDRVTVYWLYTGAWTNTATQYDNVHFQVEVAGNVIDENALPATPVAPGTTTDYIDGDTLIEKYDNGLIFWTYDGCAWVMNYYTVLSCCITAVNEGIYDCTAHPAAPVTPPTGAKTGDLHQEYYDNDLRTQVVIITWQYDGAAWVEIDTTYHTVVYNVDQTGTSIDIDAVAQGTAHTTPITVGTTTEYINGDVQIEYYDNGNIVWTYELCTWIRQINLDCGCIDLPAITPIITADTQVICVGDTVNFTDASLYHSSLDTSCQYQSSAWDFGDGTTDVGQTVAHVFTTPGLKFINLTTTCTSGLTADQTILVQVTDIQADFDSTVSGLDVTFNNLSNIWGCNPTYVWDFGDGNTSIVAEPGTYTYAADGTYTVTLTATCDSGCVDTYNEDVTVVSAPTIIAEFTITDDTLSVNNGDSTSFTDTTFSTCSHDAWLWEVSIDGGAYTTIGTTQNIPNYTPTVGGIHTVRLTATCTGAGISDTITHDVTVTELDALFTVTPTTAAPGDPVTLTDTSTYVQCPGATIDWTVNIDGGGATNIGTGTPLNYVTGAAGTYVFVETVTCPDGTTDTWTETVTVAAACAGTETCYQECTPSGQFADWTQTTTWDAGNEDFSNSVVRNQVIRDGSRISPLTNIAGTGINGTITGDGTVKTTNNGVNETGGSLVLRILADGSGDQRSILMTFDQPVDVSFQLDAMRLGQTANIAGDGNFNYIPYTDGTPQVTTVTGDGTNNINLTTPAADTTNRSGYVCGTNLNQFRFDFTTVGTGGTVVNLYFTISLQPAAASQQWKVCDDGGTLTFTDLSNIGNPLPTAVGLDWSVIACP